MNVLKLSIQSSYDTNQPLIETYNTSGNIKVSLFTLHLLMSKLSLSHKEGVAKTKRGSKTKLSCTNTYQIS